jgi:hypothetical protein
VPGRLLPRCGQVALLAGPEKGAAALQVRGEEVTVLDGAVLFSGHLGSAGGWLLCAF